VLALIDPWMVALHLLLSLLTVPLLLKFPCRKFRLQCRAGRPTHHLCANGSGSLPRGEQKLIQYGPAAGFHCSDERVFGYGRCWRMYPRNIPPMRYF